MTTLKEQFRTAVGELRGVDAANRICELCVTLLAVDAAAISFIHNGTNTATLGASSVLARTYDELQFTVGEGPCLDCVADCAPVMVEDLADATEVRWPLYRPLMLTHQIRGVTAIPIMITGRGMGALNTFQTSPGRLSGQQLSDALAAADVAQLPLLDLLEQYQRPAAADSTDPAATESSSSLVRYEVAQATGMVMGQLNIGSAEALVRLRAHAYATGTGATQVARAIIDRRLRLDQP